jgi:hypothetical protein
MSESPLDFSRPIVCYVTDRRTLTVEERENRESALLQNIQAAALAGVDWIQIREKDLSGRALLDLAREAIRLCRSVGSETGTRVFINDRLDVAWSSQSDGVHLGERSLPLRDAVRAAGKLSGERNNFTQLPQQNIGVSCHCAEWRGLPLLWTGIRNAFKGFFRTAAGLGATRCSLPGGGCAGDCHRRSHRRKCYGVYRGRCGGRCCHTRIPGWQRLRRRISGLREEVAVEVVCWNAPRGKLPTVACHSIFCELTC